MITRGFPEQELLLSKGFNNLFITLKTIKSLQILAQYKGDLVVSGNFTVKHFINTKQIDGALIERMDIELLKPDLYIALSKNISSNDDYKMARCT